jgi:hypothetical protein
MTPSIIIDFLSRNMLVINFICLSTIFVGSLYTVIHSRIIPQWIRAPLWYNGVGSLLVCLSILCEWTLGSDFRFSYTNFNVVGELMVKINIAIICASLFINTIFADVKNIQNRK